MSSAFQRPALDLLNEVRRGKAASELTEEIHQLIAAVRDTGKKGQVQLTLTVEPDKDSDGERIRITDTITAKLPKRTVKSSLFYVDDDGNPVRNDPRTKDYHALVEVPTQPEDSEDAPAASRKAQA